MPGSLPGIPGLLAFGAIKFGGYVLAAEALKRAQPAIAAGRYKIAGAPTGLGILIGPPILVGVALGLDSLKVSDSIITPTTFVLLFALSALVWALVIHLFTRTINLAKSDLWRYSVLGAGWSCILDILGVVLAMVSPGRVPFC
jgi:hypothetical protein